MLHGVGQGESWREGTGGKVPGSDVNLLFWLYSRLRFAGLCSFGRTRKSQKDYDSIKPHMRANSYSISNMRLYGIWDIDISTGIYNPGCHSPHPSPSHSLSPFRGNPLHSPAHS